MDLTWTETMRSAIRKSGLSLNEIERRTGVSHATVSRFMTGKRTLTLPLAERIAKAVGVDLHLNGRAAHPPADASDRRRKK